MKSIISINLKSDFNRLESFLPNSELIRLTKYILLIIFFFAELSSAQFYYFGRNKVQYEDFDWKVLRTRHFNIYYYGEMEAVAEIGAFYAEEIYDELKVRLNHVVTRKIPLIFYNTSIQFQQTNVTPGLIPDGVGGFFEFMKGRVVLPSTGSLQDFKHVIRHELVHVFMTNKIYRTLSDHRIPPDALPPLWFVEGLAEYLSTDIDAQAEMVMRDAVINNYFVGLENIYAIYGSFLMYKEGQSFLEFISENYGEEKVLLMVENFWMYKDFNKLLEYILGKTIEEIDNEWLYSLRKKYYPLFDEKIPHNIGAKKITEKGFHFSPVHIKIDGKDYIYTSANRDGYSSIYRIELDENSKEKKDPELVLRGEKTDELESFHLFQSAIDISKEGLLAFVTKSGATDVIHFLNTSTNKIVKSFQQDNLISISSPKFSSNGNKVTFQAVDQKGFSDIYIYNILSDSLDRLINDYYDDKDPAFGKDDDEIIFTSDRTAGKIERKYNLFSIDSNSKRIRYLTYLDANVSSPIVSPDKKEIYFTSDIDSVRNIWKMDYPEDQKRVDTVKRVSRFITSAFDQRFYDKDKIIFTGFENFSFQIFLLDLQKDQADSLVIITMDLSDAGGKWFYSSLSSSSEREKAVYEKEYTLDYAAGLVSTDPVFGTQGGAIFALSDLLGDDKYFLLLYNTANVQSDFLKSFNVAVERLDLSKRVNFGYGIFHFSGRRYDIRDSDEYYFERIFGGFFRFNYPISKFQRIEALASLANSDKEVFAGIKQRKALLLTNSVSFVHDNSLWGPSGPLDGSRLLFLLGYTSDIKFSNVNYFSVIADLRHYYRIGLTTTIAGRLGFFYNEGKEARRYFMGGSWDLRGWPRWTIRGEKMWLSSLEFRFPLIDALYIKFPFFGLGFFGIRGAAFFDAGSAWDTEYETTYGSVGGGIRFNLLGVLVLRYDIGKKIENNFSSFQPGLFYQFFFGWDF
ncbi:MAG: BamA/TamA family outer membrane protein [Ignavibacteriaceae bacterium]|nr:BamA/TamA family outer membrane protein [Ignavibacteriaceae bacterium]